jgi:hypothetical protein
MLFVDPRQQPKPNPPTERPSPRLADSFDELAELFRLCRQGRLYDVERWIAQGKPLQVADPKGAARRWSPLSVALEQRSHALTILLLCNGYDVDREPLPHLTRAVESGRSDLVNLLLDFGADPRLVDVEVLLGSHDSALFERFYSLGVDFCRHHALALALGYHTSNKPLFGFAKRHRAKDAAVSRELGIALACHASRGNEKGALLCLWAGADPHAPTKWISTHGDYSWDDEEEDDEQLEEPSRRGTYTALSAACSSGHVALMKRFGLDPGRDDIEGLFRSACNAATIDVLAQYGLPRDAETIVTNSIMFLGLRDCDRIGALERLFELGMTWEESSAEKLAEFRRSLLKLHESYFRRVVLVLARDGACSPAITRELGRTAGFERKLIQARLLPESKRWHRRQDASDIGKVIRAFRAQ